MKRFTRLCHYYLGLALGRLLDLEELRRSSLDFFKLWPDKSLFFTADGAAVVSYGAAAGSALALADPVGPPEAIRAAISVAALR